MAKLATNMETTYGKKKYPLAENNQREQTARITVTRTTIVEFNLDRLKKLKMSTNGL
jgi:hypothetical protein